LGDEWERYLRQQVELGGAEVVLSRPVSRSVGQSVVSVDDTVVGEETSAPSSRPPDRPTARPPGRPTALQRALDGIHTRYGSRGVTRGSQLAALTARGP
jgi:hypothetical protein